MSLQWVGWCFRAQIKLSVMLQAIDAVYGESITGPDMTRFKKRVEAAASRKLMFWCG